nr:hypothetical protein Itr_chr02CG12320 [Ipomoea trifida]GLL46830.1 hypothetical protein Itr_chr14CG15450 [Ipomoea trifida]
MQRSPEIFAQKEILVQICSPQPSSPREAADRRWRFGERREDLCSGTGRDATSSESPARFLSSPPSFVKTAEWRSPPARFRSGSVVIGSAPAMFCYTLIL